MALHRSGDKPISAILKPAGRGLNREGLSRDSSHNPGQASLHRARRNGPPTMNHLIRSMLFLVFSITAVGAYGIPLINERSPDAPRTASNPSVAPSGQGAESSAAAGERYKKAIASDPQIAKLKGDIDRLIRRQGGGSRIQALTELTGQLDARTQTLAREMNFDPTAQPAASGKMPISVKPTLNIPAAAMQPGAGAKAKEAGPLVFEFDSLPGRGTTKVNCPSGNTSSSSDKLAVGSMVSAYPYSGESKCEKAAEWRYATVKLPEEYTLYRATVYLHIKRADLIAYSPNIYSTYGGWSHLWTGLASAKGNSSNPKKECEFEELDPPPTVEKVTEDLTAVCVTELSSGDSVRIGPMIEVKTSVYNETDKYPVALAAGELRFDHMRVELEKQ